MIKHIQKIHLWIAVAGGMIILAGCQGEFGKRNVPGQAKYPDYPLTNQVAALNGGVRLAVPVNDQDRRDRPIEQWFFNGFPLDAASAAALGVKGYNTSALSIERVQLINCGFYSYQDENNPKTDHDQLIRHFSEISQLLLIQPAPALAEREDFIAGNVAPPLGCVVSGTPVAGTGGLAGGCPGKYIGYVEYDNPNDPTEGWYLTNKTVAGKAYDANPTHANTEVYYIGFPPSNWACGTNIPASIYPYHFRIYFKSGSVPSGPYGLTLAGFNIVVPTPGAPGPGPTP